MKACTSQLDKRVDEVNFLGRQEEEEEEFFLGEPTELYAGQGKYRRFMESSSYIEWTASRI